MPEINPLTNEQIFLKKIAENTGSDYNTGDVSEINPLTIDQILLKEIAANIANVSGGSVSVVADGVKTNGELFNELFNALDTDKLSGRSYIKAGADYVYLTAVSGGSIMFGSCNIYNGTPRIVNLTLNSSTSYFSTYYDSSDHSETSNVPTSGLAYTLWY